MLTNYKVDLLKGFVVIAISLSIIGCQSTPAVGGSESRKASSLKSAGMESNRKKEAAIREVLNRVVLEVNQQVAEKREPLASVMNRYFHKDATFVGPGGFTRGLGKYQDSGQAKVQEESIKRAVIDEPTYKILILDVTTSGDVGWATYNYNLDTEVEGKPTTIFGYGTVIMGNTNGEWQIMHTQSSGRPLKDTDQRL